MSAASRIAAVAAVLGRACRGLVHPVIATFLLAAILSFLAADTLSGVYLLAVGVALAVDRLRGQASLLFPAPAPGPEPGERAGPEPGERAGPEPGERAGPAGTAGPWAVLSAESAAQRRAAMDRVRIPALIAAAAYAALIGWFGRFTWPATVLATIPAVAGLAVAWLASAESQAPSRRPGWAGTAPWALVWVGAAAWEIATLFLQPSLKVGSYAHPTLSYLADQPLAFWPGRSVIAFGWLALGWYLARR